MPAAPSRSVSWQPGEATTFRSDVALTGTIMPNGQIESVDAIIIKIEAAARAKFKTILVPHGQKETIDWDIYQAGNPMEH